MIITSVIMHRQRAIVRAFEQAGATSPAVTRRAEQLGLKPCVAWQQLVANAVLRCPGEGRYFLDVPNWQRWRRRRRIIAWVTAAGVLLVLLLAVRAIQVG